MTNVSKPSPLHAIHAQLGATFTDFAGWNMPVRYGSELAEHQAVREAAGLFDLSHMGEIELGGPDAGQALDYALVGNLSGLKVGRARYSMLCADDGGMLDDLVVYRTHEETFLVVANAANAALVARELEQRAAKFSAVEVFDHSEFYALIAVQGPRSGSIVRAVCDADLDALRYYACVPTVVHGREALLARTGYTGEDGFELYVEPQYAAEVWQTLTEAGRPHGLLPAGLACRDTLRLEAGMPLYGNELTAELTPYEAGLGRIVKLEKDDFVGKDALAKRAAEGSPRVLVGLQGTGRRAPRAGYPVLGPDGAPVGEVTSGALSPTLGYPVAMAYLDAELAEPQAALQVDVRGKPQPVQVVKLPFYRRGS